MRSIFTKAYHGYPKAVLLLAAVLLAGCASLQPSQSLTAESHPHLFPCGADPFMDAHDKWEAAGHEGDLYDYYDDEWGDAYGACLKRNLEAQAGMPADDYLRRLYGDDYDWIFGDAPVPDDAPLP